MKRYILLLTMAVFAIMAISSCRMGYEKDDKARWKARSKLEVVKIWVEEDGGSRKVKVDKDTVVLNKSCGDRVMWKIIPSNKNFTITFENENPFANKDINQDNYYSGKITVEPTEPPTEYPYSVTVDGIELDPGIIIWN